MRIILASQSPRRRELMDLLGIKYEAMVSEKEEVLLEGLSIIEQSKSIAYVKAKEIFDKTEGDRIIIGSDTMVIKENKVYGKPKDREDAINMLKLFKNDKHQVITSIVVIVQEGKEYKEYIDYDIADVYLSDITEKEMDEWVDSGEAYDKAGAYAIQSNFGKFLNRIDGNFYTVIGFPINKVYKILKPYIN